MPTKAELQDRLDKVVYLMNSYTANSPIEAELHNRVLDAVNGRPDKHKTEVEPDHKCRIYKQDHCVDCGAHVSEWVPPKDSLHIPLRDREIE